MTPSAARLLAVGDYVTWHDDRTITGRVLLVTPRGFSVKWGNGSIEFVRFDAEHLKQIETDQKVGLNG